MDFGIKGRTKQIDGGSPMNKPFAERIAAMNAMYKLPAHARPTLPADVADRLARFKATLLDEVHEIDEIVKQARDGAAALDIAVAVADLLGDTACRWKRCSTSSWTATRASSAPTASRSTTRTASFSRGRPTGGPSPGSGRSWERECRRATDPRPEQKKAGRPQGHGPPPGETVL
jgi:hypothetical protein